MIWTVEELRELPPDTLVKDAGEFVWSSPESALNYIERDGTDGIFPVEVLSGSGNLCREMYIARFEGLDKSTLLKMVDEVYEQ